MLRKANRCLFMVRTLKRFGFDCNELKTVYEGYVRSTLEYADVVWHSGLTNKQSDDIEKIQKRACRTILGHSYLSYTDALELCNLDSLSNRRVDHCRGFAEGLPKSDRTSGLLPPSRLASHGRCLRSATNISQLRVKTNRFQNSPIPYFINLFNTQ